MDTPLAAAIHKENVHGEKATVTMKPDKLKTAKTGGKKRKASADLRSTYIPVAGDCTTKKHHILTDEEIRQCCQWPNHILTDEEIKQCREWSEYEIEKSGHEDEERQPLTMNSTISEMIASLMDIPISKLEQPFLSDEEGYKTDGSDFDSSKLVPGPNSLVYTPKELDDAFDKARLVLEEYPFPELKLDDD